MRYTVYRATGGATSSFGGGGAFGQQSSQSAFGSNTFGAKPAATGFGTTNTYDSLLIPGLMLGSGLLIWLKVLGSSPYVRVLLLQVRLLQE